MRRSLDWRWLVVMPAALLAGCGDDPMSNEDVLSQARTLDSPMPGLYRTEAELVSFEVPGLPPAQADRFRQQMAGLSSQPQERCVSQREAEKGFEDLLRSIGEGVNGMQCAFERFETDPPQLDALLSCTDTGAIEAEIAFEGTAGAEEMDLTMRMDASSPVIPGNSMKLEFAVAAERLGECPDGADPEEPAR